MLPVPINKTQTVVLVGKKIAAIPIIVQTIKPEIGVARKGLSEKAILCSSKVLKVFFI